MKLIVGVDPGTKSGISALDLDGKFVFTFSKKHLSLKEAIKILSERGDPVIVACDVRPAPEFVEKIASAFKANLFVPEKSLAVREKFWLVSSLGKNFKDKHKRSSLASAVKCYRHFSKRLEKLKKILRSEGLSEYEEEAKVLTLKYPRKNVLKIIKKEA